jgi:ubiquinone biosynthesis protein Coq4
MNQQIVIRNEISNDVGMNTDIKPKVFISYAHADGQAMVQDFWSSLSSFLKTPQRTWSKWDDKEIMVGQEWDNTIHQALDAKCNCCLLLVSELFGKSSYIVDTEWPKTLVRYEDQGIIFFPVVFGVLEGDLKSLPDGMEHFQIYWPTVSDLYNIPPTNIPNPDQTRLCYKDVLQDTVAKERFFVHLAKQMNKNFDGYLQKQIVKAVEKEAASFAGSKATPVDLRQFITPACDEDELARTMFGSFSYEKRYRDSNSKAYYFRREIDIKLDEALRCGKWILLEGHPLAGKTRASFEAIKRLWHDANDFALWPFAIPEQTDQPLHLPTFPNTEYRIVWMDDFDAHLRDLLKRGYSSNDINNFLKLIADNNLILFATARTGPAYFDLRHRFDLDDHLWDKLESFPVSRLSGLEERTFLAWYRKNFNELLSDKFDHNPGSLFLDLKAMRDRWANMDNIAKKHGLKLNVDHAKDLLKSLHSFYVMESYSAGGIFPEEDIRFYLQKKYKYHQDSSALGRALSDSQWAHSPFSDDKWEELVRLLTQDRYNLGFLRRESGQLITETAYLDYIVAPEGDRNIVRTIETIFSKEEREHLGLLITIYNFSDVVLKRIPQNEKQLKKLVRKLKPLGLERNIQVWNQIIDCCPSTELALKAMALCKKNGIKPDYFSYKKILKRANGIDNINTIIQEMYANDISPSSNEILSLVSGAKDYKTASELVSQLKIWNVAPNIYVYNTLLERAPDYATRCTVIDEMKAAGVQPNNVTYNRLLTKVPDYATAQAVINEMKGEGVQPNNGNYDRLLERIPDYTTAQAVIDEMKGAGVQPNNVTYNRLLTKVPDYATAQAVINEMKGEGVQPNNGTYDRLLERIPDYTTAQAVINEMKGEGVQPSNGNYDRLLEKVPDYTTGRIVIDEMKAAGVQPNNGNYDRLLERISDYTTAQAIINEMKGEGVQPNNGNYDRLIERIPDYTTGRTVIDEMKAEGVQPNNVTYDRLIERIPDYTTAQAVINEMKGEGVQPNNGNYDRLLERIPDYATGRIVINEMKGEGVQPSNGNYDRLLAKVPDYATGRIVIDEMKAAGVQPTHENYKLLLQKVPRQFRGQYI